MDFRRKLHLINKLTCKIQFNIKPTELLSTFSLNIQWSMIWKIFCQTNIIDKLAENTRKKSDVSSNNWANANVWNLKNRKTYQLWCPLETHEWFSNEWFSGPVLLMNGWRISWGKFTEKILVRVRLQNMERKIGN